MTLSETSPIKLIVREHEWAKALRTGYSDLLTRAEEGMRVVEIARTATEQAMKARGSCGADGEPKDG